MNLFLLLSQLGPTDELMGELLLPVGTVYDPFVCRGLDALIYALYSGARFVLAGTPSGISLSREGGAHQSTITPSIGLELPGITYAEPAYAAEVDWLLRDGLERVAAPRAVALPAALDEAGRPDAVRGAGRAARRRGRAGGRRRRRATGSGRGRRTPT